MKKITIIFSALNEGEEPLNTIKSIEETADKKLYDIIVFNDASNEEFPKLPDHVKVITNERRKGIAANIDKGVKMAKTPYIFICNARMRFPEGWLEKGIEALDNEKETLFCTTSVKLTYDQTDLSKATEKRYGADIHYTYQDKRFGAQILQPIWKKPYKDSVYKVPCALGASYFITKKWYQYIKGFEGMYTWGGICEFISLKSWLAGGTVKILKDVEIGNIYREHGHNKYTFIPLDKYYNKMFIAYTLLELKDFSYLLKQLKSKEHYTMLVNMLLYHSKIMSDYKKYFDKIRKFNIKEKIIGGI